VKWLAAACEGYACPPEHSTPAQDVIVQVTTKLSETGVDLDSYVGVVIAALLIVIVGGGLVAESVRVERKK